MLIKGMREGDESKISLRVSEVAWFMACGLFVIINIVICELCLENLWDGGRTHYFVNFFLWGCFSCRWGWFYTPVCGYKFHALAVYLHQTFAAPSIRDTFGIHSKSEVELFYGNDQRVKAVAYFCKQAPSWIFLYLEDGLRKRFPPLEFYLLGR